MAYLATNIFLADGVKTYWDFDFAGVSPDAESGTAPYLYPEDVKALELYRDVDGNAQAATRIVLINPLQPTRAVIVGAPVAAGRQVKIYRETEIRFPLVDYRDRQSVSEFDLDLANRQAIFVAQETQDAASNNMALDKNDNYDVLGRRIVNLAPAVDDTDAVNLSQLKHALRVPEGPIPALPDISTRANKLVSFDAAGNPAVVLPAAGSATDLEMRLALPSGSGLVGHGAFTVSSAIDGLIAATQSNFESVHLTYIPTFALVVPSATHLIDYNNTVYRVKVPAVFPFTLTGTFATDEANLVVVGDETLRSNLKNTTSAALGANLIGYFQSTAGFVGRRLSAKMADETHVNDFGADPTGATDSTAAIAAAYASISGVGKLKFGKGIYKYTENVFDGASGLHLEGHGAINATRLRCIATGTSGGTRFRSTFDCTASFITFDHEAGFNGYLADMRHAPGAGTPDTQGMYFFRCTFSSANFSLYTGIGVTVDQATLVTFEGCKFGALLRAVDGQNPAGGSYSNGIRFINCQFFDNVGYCFNYLGEMWSFQDCNFQASHDGSQKIAFSDNTTTWLSLAFRNCGVYDATEIGPAYLNLGTGSGLTISAGMWGGRGDLGLSTLLSATGVVTCIIATGVTFSMFTNISVAGVAGCLGWNFSGGNKLVPITGQPITNTTMVTPRANAPDARFDGNFPNVSLRSGTGPNTDWRTYNPDGTYWCGGVVTGIAAGGGAITIPTGFVGTALLHADVQLQAPASTASVISLTGALSSSSIGFYIQGSGNSSVRWMALMLA